MKNDYFKQTEETWDTIAQSFDTTRKNPWLEVVNFIDTLSGCNYIVDLGCGNGRHLLRCAKQCKYTLGIDISSNLLQIAKQSVLKQKLKNVDFIQGNNCSIPLKNSTCNAIIYIAAMHNIKKRNNRIQSLEEVNRILKDDGRALVSVWSREQVKFRDCFNDLTNDHSEVGDIMIYWKQNNMDVPRFYHLYSKEEFIEDLEQSGLEIEQIIEIKLKSKKYSDNYFAKVRKG